LLDHGFGDGAIDLTRILDATRNDWGLEHSIHRSPATLEQTLGTFGLPTPQVELVRTRLGGLGAALHGAPKGAKWKLRSRVGERVRWYEEPEEARA
jgi:hypothetical protein